MSYTPATTTAGRRGWARAAALQPFLVPLASLLVALAVFGAAPRLLIVVTLPALVIGPWPIGDPAVPQ